MGGVHEVDSGTFTSDTTKFYTIELPSAYTLHQLMSGVVSALTQLQLQVGGLLWMSGSSEGGLGSAFIHVEDKGVKLGQEDKGSQ